MPAPEHEASITSSQIGLQSRVVAYCCLLLLLAAGTPALAGYRPIGLDRAVGRNLHPSFARERSLYSAPKFRGSFLSAAQTGSSAAARPTALWLPLYPYELGAYVTTLSLGDPNSRSAPPQSVTGLIDTGSGIIHFPCLGCSGDGCDSGRFPDLEFYHAAASPSFVAAQCSDPLASFLVYGTQGGSVNAMNCTWFRDQDSDGQAAGSLLYAGGNSANFLFFRDNASVGYAAAPAAPPFRPLVACDYEAGSTTFGAGFSGIFGMNFQPASLYSQLVSAYRFAPEMSFCLGDGQGSASKGISNDVYRFNYTGVMAVGAVKPLVPPSPERVWTTPLTFTAGSSWYTATSYINVALTGLFVGTAAVLDPTAGKGQGGGNKPVYNFFLDTGNAVLSYPPALIEPLRAAWLAALRKVPIVESVKDLVETNARLEVKYRNASRRLSHSEKDLLFPTIYFQFDGTGKVPFRPSSYLVTAGPSLTDGPIAEGTELIFMANSAISIGSVYTGVLGNAWLNRMLVQVKQDLVAGGGTVTMTTVDDCADIKLVAA